MPVVIDGNATVVVICFGCAHNHLNDCHLKFVKFLADGGLISRLTGFDRTYTIREEKEPDKDDN